MRLKSRDKIQKYVSHPSDDKLNANDYNESCDEEEHHGPPKTEHNNYEESDEENECSLFSKREEDMLIFEIFVESLFGDLNKISKKNSVFKASLPHFKRRKEIILDFMKTGHVNMEASDWIDKSKISNYQQAIFYTEDLITKLLKNLVRDSINKFNNNNSVINNSYKRRQEQANFHDYADNVKANYGLSNSSELKSKIDHSFIPNITNRLETYSEYGQTASSTSTLSNKEFSSYDDDQAQTNESINENDLLDADEYHSCLHANNNETNHLDEDDDDDEDTHGESYNTEYTGNIDQTHSVGACYENDSIQVKEEDGSGQTGEFNCNSCPKIFNKKENLARHMRIHGSEKQSFECKYCNIRFTRKQNLKRHLKIHTGENMFSCELCDKKFPRKDYLVSHLKHHTGEKPFECKSCPKRFTHKNDLARHELTHTGQKTYDCNECDKSFLEKSHLVRHLKTRKHLMKA